MAAAREHLELSNFIKFVHKSLREDSRTLGIEKAWIKHCENRETLEKYATAMKELATEHWEHNFGATNNSRIMWVVYFAEEYFQNGVLLSQRIREQEILKLSCESLVQKSNSTHCVTVGAKLNLLDVGSCYNPFNAFKQFNVTAVDIAPASDDVVYCDFLNLKVVDKLENDLRHDAISELKIESFHIVVFSLLLEYLPSSEQRILCCEKAYDLLMPEGLLFIITPDSKHVGSNANLMKSWRYALALLGFSRIKYEKLQHVHCIAFRKCLSKEFSLRWVKMHSDEGFTGSISIPQDFSSTSSENIENDQHEVLSEGQKLDLLSELPQLD